MLHRIDCDAWNTGSVARPLLLTGWRLVKSCAGEVDVTVTPRLASAGGCSPGVKGSSPETGGSGAAGIGEAGSSAGRNGCGGSSVLPSSGAAASGWEGTPVSATGPDSAEMRPAKLCRPPSREAVAAFISSAFHASHQGVEVSKHIQHVLLGIVSGSFNAICHDVHACRCKT